MSFTIFSIDFKNNPLRMNVFMNYLALCKRAGMSGNVIPMIGSYKGQMEHSFICNRSDFDLFIRGTVYIRGQESVLHVASGNKMETHLEFLADGTLVALGSMHEVSREQAMASDAWTYRPDMGVYWVAKEGNPDILPPREGWPAHVEEVPYAMAAE